MEDAHALPVLLDAAAALQLEEDAEAPALLRLGEVLDALDVLHLGAHLEVQQVLVDGGQHLFERGVVGGLGDQAGRHRAPAVLQQALLVGAGVDVRRGVDDGAAEGVDREAVLEERLRVR